MATLAQPAFARGALRVPYGYLGAAAIAVGVLRGWFHDEPGASSLRAQWALAVGVAAFAVRLWNRLRSTDPPAARAYLDLELGLLLLSLVHAGVQVQGGLLGELYPAVYVLVALVASFAAKWVAAVVVGCAIVLEAAVFFGTEQHSDGRPFLVHVGFVLLFGLLSHLFTRAELVRVRVASRRAIDEEKEKARGDARLFRLTTGPKATPHQDGERFVRSSLEEVHQALVCLLDLLRRTLDLHSCVLLLQDDGDGRLHKVGFSSAETELAEGPFAAGEGVVGAVAKRRAMMKLDRVRPGYRGIGYYRGAAPVTCFIGLPIGEQTELRGVLCADRVERRPFDDRDEEILGGAVQQLLRAVENERAFVQLERNKREQTVLHKASQQLGAARSADEVIEAALAAGAEIEPYDFAALTLYDRTAKRHTIRRAVGEGADALKDLSFRENNSLVAMAVQNRHYLPLRGNFDPRQQVVYTRRVGLPGMTSLLVIPLVVREDALGTIAFAARRPRAFREARPTLQVLANNVAVSLANAAAVRRLEEMATTDGLTGCLNKRAWLGELERRLRSAGRFNRKLSLLVTDLDHFKVVNDTYGHAAGDQVLRQMGEILQRVKRETDVVGRYGGEEFCVLCEETDATGATHLAERLREELRETVVSTERGPLQVTCSIGLATFPEDAQDSRALFDAADRALYAAKKAGRDRVCGARARPTPRPGRTSHP